MTGWDGILDPGEEVIWQGRPDGALVFRPANLLTFLFGLFFAGFAVFWMVMAAQGGGFSWMFGLIHFGVGIGLSVGGSFWNAFKRRHSWYTLTNRRAFIATDMPIKGRALQSYPITADTVLSIEDNAMPNIYFAETLRENQSGQHRIKVGFERIADGRDVYRMMRDLQHSTVEEKR